MKRNFKRLEYGLCDDEGESNNANPNFWFDVDNHGFMHAKSLVVSFYELKDMAGRRLAEYFHVDSDDRFRFCRFDYQFNEADRDLLSKGVCATNNENAFDYENDPPHRSNRAKYRHGYASGYYPDIAPGLCTPCRNSLFCQADDVYFNPSGQMEPHDKQYCTHFEPKDDDSYTYVNHTQHPFVRHPLVHVVYWHHPDHTYYPFNWNENEPPNAALSTWEDESYNYCPFVDFQHKAFVRVPCLEQMYGSRVLCSGNLVGSTSKARDMKHGQHIKPR